MLRRVGEEIQDGRYRLLRRIGRGSMGAVFRAYDRQLQIDVVIKFPAPPRDEAEGAEFLVRFERELGTLVHLSHPHIVGILNVGVHEGTPYIVMQYLPGGSLKDMMEGQGGAPLPHGSIRHWLMEVAKALDSIHDRHYIHRDVKPANILFDREGNAFLGDFGIVKLRRPSTMGEDETWMSGSSETAPEFLMGTPNYVAPEAVLGLPVDGRLDQYALAMTVHEALCGRNVMTGPTPAATVLNQTKLEVPSLNDLIPGVSERLSAAVDRALSKNPEARFPTCVAFAREALADFIAEPTGQPFTTLLRGQAAAEGVSCPACGCDVPVGPEHAGERIRCPRCHQIAQVLDGGSRAVLSSSTDEFSFTVMPVQGGSSGSGALAVATAPAAVAAGEGMGSGSGSGPILLESSPAPPDGRRPPESRRRMVVELLILGGLALLGLSNRGWLSPPKPEPPGGNIAEMSLVPDRKPVELNIAYSTDQREWLEQAARDFAETPDGRHVKVRLFGMGSLEAARAILDGEKPIPFHAWIPASGAYRRAFEVEWRAKHKDSNPIFRSDPLSTTPLVFAMWQSRYDAFHRRYPEVSFRTIAEAMQAGDHAWERITGEIEWGRFKFGHADPNRSNSGMLALIMMAYDYHDKRRGLTRDDIANPGFRDWLLSVEEDISRPDGALIPSTGPLMKAMVQHGPSEFDCVLVYEGVAVDYAAAARDRWEGLKLTYAHPNLWNEHPYSILNVPWSSDDHREAAEIFLDFLLSEPVQRQALAHGLRPVHPAVSIRSAEGALNSKEAIQAGVQVDVPLNLAQPLDLDVLRDLLEIQP